MFVKTYISQKPSTLIGLRYRNTIICQQRVKYLMHPVISVYFLYVRPNKSNSISGQLADVLKYFAKIV